MIGVTFFGIFLTPIFFSVIIKFFGPKPASLPSPQTEGVRPEKVTKGLDE